MPTFGLMIDVLDFERMVQADSKLHEEFLYANPSALIEGYDLGMKTFRGFAIIHDKRQARFRGCVVLEPDPGMLGFHGAPLQALQGAQRPRPAPRPAKHQSQPSSTPAALHVRANAAIAGAVVYRIAINSSAKPADILASFTLRTVKKRMIT